MLQRLAESWGGDVVGGEFEARRRALGDVVQGGEDFLGEQAVVHRVLAETVGGGGGVEGPDEGDLAGDEARLGSAWSAPCVGAGGGGGGEVPHAHRGGRRADYGADVRGGGEDRHHVAGWEGIRKVVEKVAGRG